MSTSNILKLAKAQLTSDNWGQSYDAVVHDHKRCVLTAIGIAEKARRVDWESDAEDVLKCVCLGDPDGFLSKWNDAPERTFQDVLDAFDAAIAIAQQLEREEVSRV